MTLDRSALLDLLGQLKLTDVTDQIRSATETLYQELIGAKPYERNAERTALRNGSRPRTLTTTAGDLSLKMPKLRQGSFFPALLERRRRIGQALFAVVMEAYLRGVSTRKVDDPVKALGADIGISKSEVSRICADLDQKVGAFRDRDLSSVEFPYVFLEATYCRATVEHRVVSQAVVVAVGVASDGRREVLGFDGGDGERDLLDNLSPHLEAAGLGQGEAGNHRCSHRVEESDRYRVPGRFVAALPGPFPPQRVRCDPEEQWCDGRLDHPHDLRPT